MLSGVQAGIQAKGAPVDSIGGAHDGQPDPSIRDWRLQLWPAISSSPPVPLLPTSPLLSRTIPRFANKSLLSLSHYLSSNTSISSLSGSSVPPGTDVLFQLPRSVRSIPWGYTDLISSLTASRLRALVLQGLLLPFKQYFHYCVRIISDLSR